MPRGREFSASIWWDKWQADGLSRVRNLPPKIGGGRIEVNQTRALSRSFLRTTLHLYSRSQFAHRRMTAREFWGPPDENAQFVAGLTRTRAAA